MAIVDGVKWLRIDWRVQLQRMEPYLSGRGGVVCVVGSRLAACNTFAKLIRSMITTKQESVCIQLNPDDTATRTTEGIMATFALRLGIAFSSLGTTSVVTGIHAEGNVTVNNVSVTNQGSPFDVSDEQTRREAAIVGHIGELMKRGQRVAIILNNWHKVRRSTSDWFWIRVWDDGLARLVDQGLLLVVIHETTTYKHKDPAPQPNARIDLPEEYQGETLAEATKDLAELLCLVRQEDPYAAQKHAEAFLEAWQWQPSQVFSGLAAQRTYYRG